MRQHHESHHTSRRDIYGTDSETPLGTTTGTDGGTPRSPCARVPGPYPIGDITTFVTNPTTTRTNSIVIIAFRNARATTTATTNNPPPGRSSMMMTPISSQQTAALAELVHQLRPEWDQRGIAAAIREARNHHDTRDLCHAAIELAHLPAARTPKVLVHAGPHWRLTTPTTSPTTQFPPCQTHGGQTRRPDGTYPCCDPVNDNAGGTPLRSQNPPPADFWDRVQQARTTTVKHELGTPQ